MYIEIHEHFRKAQQRKILTAYNYGSSPISVVGSAEIFPDAGTGTAPEPAAATVLVKGQQVKQQYVSHRKQEAGTVPVPASGKISFAT